MANQGITDLQTQVAALTTFAQTVATELTALESAQGDDDKTVESLSQQIGSSIATIQAAMPTAVAPVTTPPTQATIVGTTTTAG